MTTHINNDFPMSVFSSTESDFDNEFAVAPVSEVAFTPIAAFGSALSNAASRSPEKIHVQKRATKYRPILKRKKRITISEQSDLLLFNPETSLKEPGQNTKIDTIMDDRFSSENKPLRKLIKWFKRDPEKNSVTKQITHINENINEETPEPNIEEYYKNISSIIRQQIPKESVIKHTVEQGIHLIENLISTILSNKNFESNEALATEILKQLESKNEKLVEFSLEEYIEFRDTLATSSDVMQTPEYKSLEKAIKNNEWKPGELKTLTFTTIPRNSMPHFMNAIHYAFRSL